MELFKGCCAPTIATLLLLALFQERRPQRSQQVSPLKLHLQHDWLRPSGRAAQPQAGGAGERDGDEADQGEEGEDDED